MCGISPLKVIKRGHIGNVYDYGCIVSGQTKGKKNDENPLKNMEDICRPPLSEILYPPLTDPVIDKSHDLS